jgi:membrane-bound ClpP family serine protease
MNEQIVKYWYLILTAVAAAAALSVYFINRRKNTEDDIAPEDIIGKVGTVYLKIPGGRGDTGKVNADVKGTSLEIQAVADKEIPRGAAVRIVEQIDTRRFLVEKVENQG